MFELVAFSLKTRFDKLLKVDWKYVGLCKNYGIPLNFFLCLLLKITKLPDIMTINFDNKEDIKK